MQTEFVKTESKTIFKKAPSLTNKTVNGELFKVNECVKGTISNIFENQDGKIIFIKTEKGDVGVPLYMGLKFFMYYKKYKYGETEKVGKEKGDPITIHYLGTKTSPKSNRAMHDFFVE
jgi:hypothetical protein